MVLQNGNGLYDSKLNLDLEHFMNDTKVALHFLAKEVQHLKRNDDENHSEYVDLLLGHRDEVEEKIFHLESKLESATKQISSLVEEKRRTSNMISRLTQRLHESELRHSRTRRELAEVINVIELNFETDSRDDSYRCDMDLRSGHLGDPLRSRCDDNESLASSIQSSLNSIQSKLDDNVSQVNSLHSRRRDRPSSSSYNVIDDRTKLLDQPDSQIHVVVEDYTIEDYRVYGNGSLQKNCVVMDKTVHRETKSMDILETSSSDDSVFAQVVDQDFDYSNAKHSYNKISIDLDDSTTYSDDDDSKNDTYLESLKSHLGGVSEETLPDVGSRSEKQTRFLDRDIIGRYRYEPVRTRPICSIYKPSNHERVYEMKPSMKFSMELSDTSSEESSCTRSKD